MEAAGVSASGSSHASGVRARALLSPFDSLVWAARSDRAHLRHAVPLEVYTPAPKRVHGYYVLPFLLDDELVARVDLEVRPEGVDVAGARARISSPGHARASDNEVAAALEDEVRSMADWLGLDHVDPPRVRF